MSTLVSDSLESKKDSGYLVLDSVSKSYRDNNHIKNVLDKVSFQASKGSFVTIFGPNGSGKTTLFNIISGLTESDTKSITIDGRPVNQSKISFLFQNFKDTLFPWKTCLENIAFPLELEGFTKSERIEKVNSLLETLDINVPLYQYPYQCSGGQNQLVAIARALILNPNLLLMDEPFSALDYETRLSMENKLLDIWSKSKVTTLFISHDVDEAVYLSDKVVVLSRTPTNVVDEIFIRMSRPRNLSMMQSPEFYEIRNRILQSFHKGVNK